MFAPVKLMQIIQLMYMFSVSALCNFVRAAFYYMSRGAHITFNVGGSSGMNITRLIRSYHGSG